MNLPVINLHKVIMYQKHRLFTANVCKINHVVNLKKKNMESSLLTEKVSIHLFLFLMKELAKLHVGFKNDEFTKMYHRLMSLDEAPFFVPQK